MRPGHDQSTPFGSSAASQPEGRKSIAHRFQRWVKHYKTTSPVRDEKEDVSNNRANRSILSSLTGLGRRGPLFPAINRRAIIAHPCAMGRFPEWSVGLRPGVFPRKLTSHRIGDRRSDSRVSGYLAGLISRFVFRAWVCEVVTPVTNRSKCPSNPLVVISVTATQGRQRIRNSA